MVNKKKGYIRIISGKWRGQKIPIPKTKKIKPTLNRIKETLFNWLTPNIKNSNCLDCFSGTGALSIEALSRDALSVTLLEKNHKITIHIKKYLKKLKINNANVIETDTIKYLKKKGKPYDIIFLDPPFKKKILLIQTAFLLEKNGWLKKNTLIYIETEKKTNMKKLPKNWKIYKKRNNKKIFYYLYIKN